MATTAAAQEVGWFRSPPQISATLVDAAAGSSTSPPGPASRACQTTPRESDTHPEIRPPAGYQTVSRKSDFRVSVLKHRVNHYRSCDGRQPAADFPYVTSCWDAQRCCTINPSISTGL